MNMPPENENAGGQPGEIGNADQTPDNFNPEYPAHDTQAARLLAVLLTGQKVNPLRGWIRLGIYRLSDTKFRLKKMGWPFVPGRLDVANKFGEPCHVALYSIEAWAIQLAGECGQEYAKRELELMTRKKAA